jgi:hypothetical protein
MAAIRNLIAVVLALAGSLAWGPPTVLAVCLGRGTCAMAAAKRAGALPCCRIRAAEAPAPRAPQASAEGAPRACCGCCSNVRLGTGLDGGRSRVETPVAPSFAAPLPCIVAPALAGEVLASSGPAAPRAPPDRLLPLRI